MATFYIKSGDTSPEIQATLQDANGTAVVLTGGSVNFHMADKYGNVIIDAAATLVDAANGVVKYTFSTAPTQGNYEIEWEATYADASIETFPNSGFDLLIADRALA